MINLEQIEPLFIFEMANNHMGSLDHGLKIIKETHKATKGFGFNFGFKLQYRDLDNLIHPDFRNRMDLKYIKRFTETRLTKTQMRTLKDTMTELGFVTVCTPFDESSVNLIEEHGFDIIKVASCSFTDWPLLEHIVKTKKPIIASTAGVELEDIDKVVSFFEHRDKDFALMHCVAEYPTSDAGLQLGRIDIVKERYPKIKVGYSTHERPDNFDAIKLAIAKGVKIFEKHVGVPTDKFPLNNYSATPEQMKKWLESAHQAFGICGISSTRFSKEALESLKSLRRGAFTKRLIKKGESIDNNDVFFAMPALENHVTANDMSKYSTFYAEANIDIRQPLLLSNTKRIDTREEVYSIVQRVKAFLANSHVVVSPKVDLEISHHYGIDRFDEFGLTMITVVNRDYCKKLIILLPSQKHPEQYHKQKEETFHILHGSSIINLDGQLKEYKAGDVVTIERGVKHSFETKHGVIIEEISSTHYIDDSFYSDPVIMQNQNRKTLLTYWLE